MMKHTIEIFSAGCAMCQETIEMVKRLAGSDGDVRIQDMHQLDTVNRAVGYGIRRFPAVVIDGKLAGCCSGRGPDEQTLRQALQ